MKSAGLQRVKLPPGNWFTGNQVVGAKRLLTTTESAILRRMVRIALLLAVVAGCVFAQQTPQTTAPPMSNGTAVLVSLFKPVYPLLARQANIYGEVSVALTVRPDGTTRRR
jgi:outer membrane biosynthesis protein TonB